jgi:hypothetical protein
MARTARQVADRDDRAIARRHGQPPPPVTEDDQSRAQWARWSEDRAERDRAARIQATAQTALDKAVFAREIAAAIATDAAKLCPDWRLLRPDVAAAFMRIVRQQPEFRQKELTQRDSMIRLIQDNLPRHIEPLVQDLLTVTELITLARESSAFLVGYETGRKAGGSTRPNRGPNRIGLAEPQAVS